MSLVRLANVCSHLQNASLARLGLTSIPHTRMHLLLSVQLQKQGFISNVVLAGPSPPAKLLPRTTVEEELKFKSRSTDSVRLAFESGSTSRPGYEFPDVDVSPEKVLESVVDPGDANVVDSTAGSKSGTFPLNELFPASNLHPESEEQLRAEAFLESEPVTQVNRSSRRLWLSLKYWDGEPVMRKLKMLSKPTQKLWLSHDDLSRIVVGKRANYIEGMTRVGECIFLSTDKGIMEARECVERRIGGLVLCRVWG